MAKRLNPGSRFKLRDAVDQVDDQRVVGAHDLGQQLYVAAQLVPRVLLGDLPGNGLRCSLGQRGHVLGHGGGLLDVPVRQNRSCPLGE